LYFLSINIKGIFIIHTLLFRLSAIFKLSLALALASAITNIMKFTLPALVSALPNSPVSGIQERQTSLTKRDFDDSFEDDDDDEWHSIAGFYRKPTDAKFSSFNMPNLPLYRWKESRIQLPLLSLRLYQLRS
jgi:hypothetical protein